MGAVANNQETDEREILIASSNLRLVNSIANDDIFYISGGPWPQLTVSGYIYIFLYPSAVSLIYDYDLYPFSAPHPLSAYRFPPWLSLSQWRPCSVAIWSRRCFQYCKCKLCNIYVYTGSRSTNRLYGVLLAQCYSYFLNRVFKHDHILLKLLVMTVWYTSSFIRATALSWYMIVLSVSSKPCTLLVWYTTFTRPLYWTLTTFLKWSLTHHG